MMLDASLGISTIHRTSGSPINFTLFPRDVARGSVAIPELERYGEGVIFIGEAHVMRFLVVSAIVVLLSATAWAQDSPKWSPGPFAESRERLMKGNYEEARSAFAELAKKDAALAPQAAMYTSKSYCWVGDYDKAKTVLDEALKVAENHPDLLAERGDLLFLRGEWDAAETDTEAALKAKPDQLLARWTKARLLRERGKLKEADDAIRWIVRYYSARSNADNDIINPDELIIVAYAGTENARWHNLTRQFSFILNEVIKDAIKADPNFWPAEQMAGTMLLEKYNRPDANDAFDAALKINPKAADPMVGKGQAALQKFDVKEAENYASLALKENPHHPAALRLMADVELIAGDLIQAQMRLLAAKAVNPRDAATLGRLAGVFFLAGKTKEFNQVVQEVEAFDEKPGVFYHELADCIESHKRYTQAEMYYKKAADLRPMLAGPRTGLAMLQLRLGNETEGRKLLDEAFKADPFNVRLANSIKVMNHLEKYQTISTEHYDLRFDPEKDRILAEFVAEYLEATHEELKQQFGFEPSGKILIEIFNSHEMFSGRTVGLPDLHTIGACTGRVVAMASPEAKGVNKRFNWGRVIRHELTHIFNLAQTDFQCPHWLTEGLAVRNENMARPQMWTAILRDRMATNELFTLDTVMLGFVRPKGPDEWTLAYCQSQLYVEYLTKTHGEAAVGKLLDIYRTGVDTGTALKRAIGVDKEAFEIGYRAYLDEVIKPFGAKPRVENDAKPMTFAELEKAHEENPDDVEVAAKYADQLYRRGKVNEARKLVDQVLEKKPGQILASITKARLLARSGDEEGAKSVLKDAAKANPDDPKLLLAVSRLHIEAKEYTEAAKLLEHGRKIAPLDGNWMEQLAQLYQMTGDTEKLLSVLQEVIAADPDELTGRIKLAQVNLEASKPADAERYAHEALQIDVNNMDARTVLLKALKAQQKNAEAEKIEKRFQ
jgi:cellulose synthase operon protein C